MNFIVAHNDHQKFEILDIYWPHLDTNSGWQENYLRCGTYDLYSEVDGGWLCADVVQLIYQNDLSNLLVTVSL